MNQNHTRKTIGVVETGLTPDELKSQYPDYGAMISQWLQPATDAALSGSGRTIGYTRISPIRGEMFPGVDQFDGYIYSGSKHGVYDDIPWIEPMMTFIRDVADAKIPQLGICFGHQVMAQALGGKAEKSTRGWGCGIQTYALDTAERATARNEPQAAQQAFGGAVGSDFVNGAAHLPNDNRTMSLSVLLLHQDQVTQIPPNTQVIGGNEFCPFGALRYLDTPAISVQFHPEFDNRYLTELLNLRGGTVIDKTVAESAVASLTRAPDNDKVAAWCAEFIIDNLWPAASA